MDQKYKIIYGIVAFVATAGITLYGYYGYYDTVKKNNEILQQNRNCLDGCLSRYRSCEKEAPSGWNKEFLECHNVFKACNSKCQDESEKAASEI